MTFVAVVAAPRPPPQALSVPGIPNFRVPSGGSVDTVFPAATGGTAPYAYSLTGLPPGIAFTPSTRRASGTLPTVTTDTAYTVTYAATDSAGGSASVSFVATVEAPQVVVIGSPPGPPPTENPDPPPPVSVVRVYSLPFTVSETGVSGEKSYRFRLDSRTEVSVSLTGMNRDIDCRVNSSSCTNHGGTSNDSWSGTLDAGTHSVTVYPYGGGAGNWTLSVSGTSTSPPPPAPTPTPPPPPPPTTPPTTGPIVKTGVNVSSSQTYLLTLSHRVEVTVELTGMTTDFDCTVSGNRCTNRGGTRDDSWSGTLDAGDHKIVVYPYGGGSGDYTLTVSAQTPSTGGSTGTTTRVTTLVDASETNISTSQTYSFTLTAGAEVDVALTDLTIDFDCRVGTSRCTNRWGTLDDSWSDDLAAGDHSVVVYPYDPGPGDYSLTVTATETVTHVATPLAGGPTLVGRVCHEDEEGNAIEDTCQGIYADVTTVTGDDPGDDPGPPPGAGPGEGTPGPGDGGDDGGDGGGGGGTDASNTYVSSWADVLSTTDSCAENFDKNDRLGINHGGVNDTPGRENHSGVDIQGNDGDPVYAWRGGRIVPVVSGTACGHGVEIQHSDGSTSRYCHFNSPSPSTMPEHVSAGDLVGHVGRSGTASGDHLHLTYTLADGDTKIEYFSALPVGGRPTAEQLNEDGC